MASNSTTDKELQAIHKELKELNRRLGRLCQASIFSLKEPVIRIEHRPIFEELSPEEEEFMKNLVIEAINSQEKQSI